MRKVYLVGAGPGDPGLLTCKAFQLLQKVVRDERKALLLVTHNPEIAEACDWIHEMQDGVIIGSHPRRLK